MASGGSSVLRVTNLVLKFALELAAFAAFALWGARTGGGALSVVLAIAAPAIAVAAWAVLAAPRSRRRLATPLRIPFELAVFALAAVALIAADESQAAEIFALLIVVNAALMTMLDQWEA